jgi:signal transduction histidine kinase/DNA-binding response OmpR family regulator
MTLNEAFSLLVEGLFGVVFVGALLDFVKRRDPVSRDVALTFSPFVGLLILTLWRWALGPPPAVLSAVLGIPFFAQPVFALHLVSLIRPVPRRVLLGAIAVLLIGVLPIVLIRPIPPVLAIAPLAAFTGVQLLTAAYLAAEARKRRGPGGRRLAVAAAATVGLAVALLLTSGAALGPEIGEAVRILALLVAVLSAFGYVVAFVPPTIIRRVWQAGAAVDYQRELLVRAGISVDAIWEGFATLASEMTGAASAVLEHRADGGGGVIATAGFVGEVPSTGYAGPDTTEPDGGVRLDVPLATLPSGDPIAAVGRAADARFVSVVDIGRDRWGHRSLVVASPYRSLFHGSDLSLLSSLGIQTSLMAERRAMQADQEALTARLEATVEALRSASRAKSDFLASMSHELRTPLSAILGFSDLMRHEPRDGDSAIVPAEWIEHVHRGGEHLLALVNDVLDLAKVEAGRMELHLEAFDLSTAVVELVNGTRPLADRKDLSVHFDVPPVTIVADRGRVRQILYNLVSNAIKFTPIGGTIRIRGEELPTSFRLAVTDTGVGISPEDLDTIFEEFRQVGADEEREGGTGLGLALAQRLIHAHGGQIEVESTVGRGTTFTVTMPKLSLPQGASAGPVAWPIPTGDPASRRDILAIEDDPSAVRLLREYLEPLGYALRAASDGEQGLAMAREHPPMAILLDVLVPRIDGWEVLRRLKADVALRNVPVVMVTVVDEREVGLALGAVDYLVKPVQRDALLSCLARLGLQEPADGQRATVLAVDDETAALDLIGGILSGTGIDVLRANSGREAIDIARRGDVDLVICDLLMPDLDGFGVVAELKSDATTSSIPILICTSHDLTDAEKDRLHGQILGIVAKGPTAREGLRGWLSKVQLDTGGARA